ncbi:MAG: L-histidine N(alpha)-methyltransferase [Isosphaeraceae bacterium]
MPIQAARHSETQRLTIISSTKLSGPKAEEQGFEFARSVHDGLLKRPKSLSFQYFYDEAGSALFEQICQLPEYYLTRTEDAILREHASAMVSGWHEPPVLIELGSGSAEKTRHLIAAALGHYFRLHYVPIDVSASAVEASAEQLVQDFPTLRVTGFVGDYQEGLAHVATRFRGPKLVIFLGSSLGNHEPEAATDLLDKVARIMKPNDRFLLGTDLAKNPSVLEAAYDDSQGVTAQFNRNLLVRINRELGADFRLDQFHHRAVYRPDLGRVEMHLVSLTDQTVRIPGASVTVRFARGEAIHTENSHKYTLEALQGFATRAGFVEEEAWTDARGWFRVQNWRTTRREASRSPEHSSAGPV